MSGFPPSNRGFGSGRGSEPAALLSEQLPNSTTISKATVESHEICILPSIAWGWKKANSRGGR